MLKKMKRSIIIITSAIIFIASVTGIIFNRYNSQQTEIKFQELRKSIQEQTNKQTIGTKFRIVTQQYQLQIRDTQDMENQEEATILPEYEELYNQNNDLYGWIKIEDTVIDYPVMFTPETPIYYYHRNYEKEESNHGTPFIDGTTIPGKSENIIIYAHHMKDGSMFGSLKKYKDISYYENHKYIEFNSIYEKNRYEIIAVSKAILYYEEEPKDEYLFYNHIELDTKEEFNDYIENAKKNAYFETQVTAEYGDELITLCTCDYWTENARLIIVAKKI